MWLYYAFITAFSQATSDAITKKTLQRADEYIVAWLRLLSSVPYLLIALFIIEMPETDSTFWTALITALPLEVTAFILYIRALKESPLSLTIPFLAFTPVFLIFTSFLILGELPDKSGAAGVILITAGAYTLNLHMKKKGLLKPIKAIIKERGSLMMLIVSFIYSITSSLGKLAILHSSPIFFGAVYFIILALAFTPIVMFKSRNNLGQIIKNYKFFGLLGFFHSIMIITHMIAMSLTQVTYMIAVKRTSLLFSAGYGYFLFKEEKMRERLLGSILMIIGVVLIVVF
ncbi:MAG: EamA family transporter [Nitrospirae bacterium]|nr:EamA family transporter [Nitrospirota bacterium]